MFIIKITISSIVIGLKDSYFPLILLSGCYRTVCYRTIQPANHIQSCLEDSRQVKILKKTTTLLNLQNMFRQKLLSSSVDRFTKP